VSTGLAQGDLIVAAGGRPVSTIDDLFDALEAGGDTVELSILRGADERTIPSARRPFSTMDR
jgi:S1-C subfamily serine protease